MRSIPLRVCLAVFVLASLSACGMMVGPAPVHHGGQPTPPDHVMFAPPAPARTAQTPPAPAAPSAPQEPEWDRIVRQLRDQAVTGDQEKTVVADEHYRLAEKHFENAQFDQAEVEVERALGLKPDHMGAQALRSNLQIVTGRAPVTPQDSAVRKFMDEQRAIVQETLKEIHNAHQRGLRHYNDGQFGDAEDQFKLILQYVRWLPMNVDLEQYRVQAQDMLAKSRSAARAQEIDAERLRRDRIEKAASEDARVRGREQRRQLEIMFGEAQKLFEQQRYAEAVRLADKILVVNPNLPTVRELRSVSQRLMHVAAETEGQRAYIEEWKRTFEAMDLMTVPGDLWEFPKADVWTMIDRRGPKRIQQEGVGGSENADDVAVAERLKQTPMTIDLPQNTLAEFMDAIRNYMNINVVPVNVDAPPESVSATYTDVPVATILDLTLDQHNLTWLVEDGIIQIVTKAAAGARTTMEIYDVQDITFALQDFPGIDISLSTDALGTTTSTEEGEPQEFTTEQLQTLITDTIDKGGWEAEGHSITNSQGLLIIRTLPATHLAVRRLLSDFRSSTGILVNVESRFLQVETEFLEQIGMDFRDLDRVPVAFPAFGRQPVGILNPDDINPGFNVPTRFFDPDANGPITTTSAGIVGRNGVNVVRPYGARVQNLMFADSLLSRFLQTVWGTAGGLTMQYILVDDVSVSAILRAVEKHERGHILNAPRLTLFNTQRGNTLISNQMTYIRDFNVQLGGANVVPDPEVAVVSDGISLDVRPIVSPDRRYVTLELRPTVATLTPTPPNIATIPTVIGGTTTTAGQQPGRVVNIETPQIRVQRIRTTVVVPDRGTMIIGGLALYFEVKAESSVPFWRNIPVLGLLGSEDFHGKQRNQLLIIVRAQIIIPSEEEQKRFE